MRRASWRLVPPVARLATAARRALAALVMLLAAAPALAPAAAQPVETGHAAAELVSERAAIAPGDEFLGALKLDLDPGGWHVYWRNPGDSGLPPEIDWTLPEGVAIGDFIWPLPHAIPFSGLMNYGFKEQLVLPFRVTVPAGLAPGDTLELSGDASWLICLDICIPEDAELVLRIPVEATPRADEGMSALIAGAVAESPSPLVGEARFTREPGTIRLAVADAEIAKAAAGARSLRFFPDGHEIEHVAEQPARAGPDGVTLSARASNLAPAEMSAFAGVLVVERADGSRIGRAVSATPGELAGDLAAAEVGGGGALGLAALAALLGAAFAGGAVLNLMPCVLPVLSVKVASLAHGAHAPAEARLHGLAYLAGVLVCFAALGAALVALRAAGEQAGLGFQLQYPPVVAGFALLMFAVGLNLMGAFEIGGSLVGVGGRLADGGGVKGAFFTGVLAAFVGAPCVGPFMAPAVGVALSQPPAIVIGVFLVIGFGLAAPFVLLSFTPALARLLPKPGRWMATFRQALAFPMFLTAVWLLWVLAGQSSPEAVVLVVLGAATLGFGVWLARAAGRAVTLRAAAAAIILAAFAGPLVGAHVLGGGPAAAATASAGPGLAGEPWSPERVAQLRAEGRPVFVDFTARWCATCQVNKAVAIESGPAQRAFAEHGVAFLVADWTNRDPVIAAALAEHDRAGVPLYLMYPASGGAPEVLPQLLSPGGLAKAVERAAAR